MKNERLYIVTWITAEGMTNGQTVKNAEEAERLFDHLQGRDPTPQYIEARKIGGIVRHRNRLLRFENMMYHSAHDADKEGVQ